MPISIPYIEAEKDALGDAGNAQPGSNGRVLLATVKGDVHDIGKNIVGVVLQCNNYEVIDLGVMVPSARILETARREQVDIIGLSGLITPSLEEMSFVASELQREGFTVPLLIGGATTSRVHTAVKIEPRYAGPTVHVLDASRAVGVAGSLRERELSGTSFVAGSGRSTRTLRAQRGGRQADERRQSLERCPPEPAGHRLDRVRAAGALLRRHPPPEGLPAGGAGALHRLDAVLPDLGAGRPLSCHSGRSHCRRHAPGASSVMPKACSAASCASVCCAPMPCSGSFRPTVWAMTSSSMPTIEAAAAGRDPHAAPADGEATGPAQPGAGGLRGAAGERRCSTTSVPLRSPPGWGSMSWWPASRRTHDDYSAILTKALADRLAEAFAELLHLRVRREFWGYARNEALDQRRSASRSAIQGIRPAPGYPACPDHTEKRTLFDLLGAEKHAGITLTESFAMLPAASVSGYYFWRPESQYFGVGQDRARPSRGLCPPERHGCRGGRAVARTQPELRALGCRPCAT